MAGNYIESQVPIMQNGDFYYPLTTAKQTILPDGRRLGGEDGLNITADDVKNALSIDLNEIEQGIASGINADMLGGKTASEFVTAENAESNFIRVPMDNVQESVFAITEADHAKVSDKAIEADVAHDANMLGGKAPQYYIQPRNLLDNSYFVNPINQRGQTTYSGNTYMIDRWIMYSDNGLASITLENNALTIKANGATVVSFAQRFEKGILTADTYTLAYKDINNVMYINNNPVDRNNSDCDWIHIQTTSEINIVWVALYEGEYTADNLPPYVYKGYAAELAECRRYFHRFGLIDGNSQFGFGFGNTTTIANMTLDNVEMRITNPSITFTGTIKLHNCVSSQSLVITSLTMNHCKCGYAYINAISSNVTNGRAYYFRCENGVIDISADL